MGDDRLSGVRADLSITRYSAANTIERNA